MKIKILLLILLILSLAVGSMAQEPKWKTRKFDQFTIYYPSDSKVADQVETIVTRHWEDLRYSIPLQQKQRISIYLYPKRDEFLKAIGENSGSSIIGIAYGSGNIIRIDATQLYANLETVLAHELAHVALFTALGPRIDHLPLWFNEGMARHAEGGLSPNDRDRLSEAVTNHLLIPLSVLEKDFPKEKSQESLAYAEGASVIEYLIDHRGSTSLYVIIQRMQDGMSFETAFRDATGLIPSTLEREWSKSLRKTYRWDWINTLYTPIISAVMVLLCLLAWFMVQRRRRKIELRFDEEEFNDFLRR
jgi:hypothetical protein